MSLKVEDVGSAWDAPLSVKKTGYPVRFELRGASRPACCRAPGLSAALIAFRFNDAATNTRDFSDRVYGVTFSTIVKPPPPCSSTLLFVV
jgi:hypothetical protein